LGKKEKIHTRVITVNSYEMDDGRIQIEGVLTDERFYPFYYYSRGQYLDPGIVHEMTVQLDIALPDLEITKAAAVMNEVPMDSCREIEAFVQKLVGLKIKPGFTRKLRALLGGVEGCLHLTNLILAMGSAALQGYWTYYSRRRGGAKAVRSTDFDPGLLKDSCWMWRGDGPLFVRMMKMKEEKKQAEGADDPS